MAGIGSLSCETECFHRDAVSSDAAAGCLFQANNLLLLRRSQIAYWNLVHNKVALFRLATVSANSNLYSNISMLEIF